MQWVKSELIERGVLTCKYAEWVKTGIKDPDSKAEQFQVHAILFTSIKHS